MTGSSPETGTVNRVLRILSAFAEKDSWALNDLARTLGLPRASAHRLLNLCRPLGYVEQAADGTYGPGIELFRVAATLAAEMPINRLAEPLLQSIRDRTDETVVLVLLARQDLKMFFAASASPAHPLRYSIDRNRLQPLGWGAAGRALLAYMTPEQIATVVERAEPSPLDGRPLDPEELQRELVRIRKQGYAASFGERTADMHGLAVPLFDRERLVRGNLMLTSPHFRWDPSRREMWLDLLREAAAELSHRMGWR